MTGDQSMTACNARPPEGHPLSTWGVACHLPAEHVDLGEAHSWDIEAIAARHEILTRAMTALRERFPERKIARFDNQLPRPIYVYEVDPSTGERADRPYRSWDTIVGPWVVVTFEDPELEARRASAPEQIDNARLPAGSPMHYYCTSCGHETAELPEDWWKDPPPKLCDWCKAHESPEYAIWKRTGAVFHVGFDGAVDEDPIWEP